MRQEQTESEIYTHMIENLRLAEEAAYIIGHFYKAQDDFEYGQGFLSMGEMLKYTQTSVMNIATRHIRNAGGFR